jgi:hypothetical protein
MRVRSILSTGILMSVSVHLAGCGGVRPPSPFDPPPEGAIVRVENDNGHSLRVVLTHETGQVRLGEVPARGSREFGVLCERGQSVHFRLLAVPIEAGDPFEDVVGSSRAVESPPVVLQRGHVAVWSVGFPSAGSLVVRRGDA